EDLAAIAAAGRHLQALAEQRMRRALHERAQRGDVSLAQIRRNDGLGQAPADRLVCGPAEQSGRLAIPLDDAIAGIDGDVRIERILEDLRGLTLALCQ